MSIISFLAGCLCLTKLYGTVVPPRASAVDPIAPPPIEQKFVSSRGRYMFVVSPDVHSGSAATIGRLMRAGRRGWALLWERKLPNEPRPRFVVVTDAGSTVTFDDSFNTPSGNAVVVYNRRGRIVRRKGLEQVARAIGSSMETIQDAAKPGLGWWMGGAPSMSRRQSYVTVPIAGGSMRVYVRTGRLAFSRHPARTVHTPPQTRTTAALRTVPQRR